MIEIAPPAFARLAGEYGLESGLAQRALIIAEDLQRRALGRGAIGNARELAFQWNGRVDVLGGAAIIPDGLGVQAVVGEGLHAVTQDFRSLIAGNERMIAAALHVASVGVLRPCQDGGEQQGCGNK